MNNWHVTPKALRIGHISPCMIDVNGLRNGGVAGYIYGLAQAQALLHMEVTVLYPNVELGRHYPVASKVDRRNLKFNCIQGLFGHKRWVDQIKSLIGTVDILHIHTPYSIRTELAMWLSMRSRRPFVVHSHGKFTTVFRARRCALKRMWENCFWPWTVKRARRVVVSGEDEREKCDFSFHFASLPNALDDTFYRPRNLEYSDHASPYLLYLGALEPRKKIDLAIRSFALIKFDNVKLIVAGPDTHGLMDNLKSLAKSCGCADRVVFTGAVFGSEKLSLLQDAKALVLLSEGEGMANVMMEAIGCTTPIIYSDGCVFSEVAKNGGGTLVRPIESEIATAFKLILTDKELFMRQKEALSEMRSDYLWSSVAKKSIFLYQEVLNEYYIK